MASRDSVRAPGRLQVEFRSPTALLVAYTVNLSRGGMFIQCDTELPPEGAELDLEITLPDRSIVALQGVVTWRRVHDNDSGPRGIGVQFDSLVDELGMVVDKLVLDYSSVSILVQCKDARDRKTLLRMVKSIIGTAELSFVNDHDGAATAISKDTDLVIVDADESCEEAEAIIGQAHTEYSIPTIALADGQNAKDQIREAGAHQILNNPPSAAALRRAILNLLSTPTRVSTPTPPAS